MQEPTNMGNIQLRDIFKVLAQEASSDNPASASASASPSVSPSVKGKPYFLFLLGTDTAFKTGPIEGENCPQIDPLSYTAQAITQVLAEVPTVLLDTTGPGDTVCKAERALSYYSDSVAVVNGQTTFASNYGKRMAESVLLALHAIASGKTNLNIAAHSRGAVQGILLLHELERIKSALNEQPTRKLYDILTSSPETYINDAMKSFLGLSEDEPAGIHLLKNKFDSLLMSPFLIDPVPGNFPADVIPRCLDPVTWYDKRFGAELTQICEHELLICYDERSRSFRPLIPLKLIHSTLLGHHGTGMGNLFERDKKDMATLSKDVIKNRQSIADLVMLKMFRFFHKTTSIFSANVTVEIKNSPHQNALFNEFLCADQKQRNSQIMQRLDFVIQKKSCTESLRKTNYGLGSESGPMNSRVSYDGKNVSDKPHQTLENEFAMLVLGEISEEFKSTITLGPVVLVKKIEYLLSSLIDQMKDSSPESQKPLSTAFRDTMLFPVVLNALGSLVDTVVENYLSADLSTEQRKEFFDAIINIFSLIVPNNLEKSDAALITQLNDLFKKKLTDAFYGRLEHIKTEHEAVIKSIDAMKEGNDNFSKALKNYLSALPDNLDTDDGEVVALKEANSSDEKYREIKQTLSQEQKQFKTADDMLICILSMLKGRDDMALIYARFCSNDKIGDLCITDSQRLEMKLVEMAALYHKIETYSLGFSVLGNIVSLKSQPSESAAAGVEIMNDVEPKVLNGYKFKLIESASLILADQALTYDLRKMISKENVFYTQALEGAFNSLRYTAQNLDDVDKELSLCNERVTAQNTIIEDLEKNQLEKLGVQLKSLTQWNEDHYTVREDEYHQKKQEIVELKDQIIKVMDEVTSSINLELPKPLIDSQTKTLDEFNRKKVGMITSIHDIHKKLNEIELSLKNQDSVVIFKIKRAEAERAEAERAEAERAEAERAEAERAEAERAEAERAEAERAEAERAAAERAEAERAEAERAEAERAAAERAEAERAEAERAEAERAEAVRAADAKNPALGNSVEKLATLVNNYLKHLGQKIPESGKIPLSQSQNLKNTKIDILNDLKNTLLKESQTNETRLKSFHAILSNSEHRKTLSQRRDSGFKIFMQGVLEVFLGIVTLGIRPIVIGASRSSKFFSTAEGKRFGDEALGEIKDVIPDIDSHSQQGGRLNQ